MFAVVDSNANTSGQQLDVQNASDKYSEQVVGSNVVSNEETVDTYCLCNQDSFGDMILCDNMSCLIKWFHFSCVAVAKAPTGKWYCPNSCGNRASMKKKKE